MRPLERAAVALVRASLAVDRAQRLFDRARSAVIARWASDRFLETYNDVAYTHHGDYTAGSLRFREGLFHWEAEMARRAFPRPPATLLIGGAGGGREVYAWAAEGYRIVAFEPSLALARSISPGDGEFPHIEVWRAKYEDLPTVFDLASATTVDLRERGPFDAVVLGWPTYSHLRTRERRVRTLRQVGTLTEGPIAVSFFLDKLHDRRQPGRLSRWARRAGLSSPGDAFSVHIGFHHWSTQAEILAEVSEAGLELVDASWDDRDGRWPWIVARRRRPVSS